jgi:hypothetical protein
MSAADPIAHRVARRHRARESTLVLRTLDAPKYRVEYSNAGTIYDRRADGEPDPQDHLLRRLQEISQLGRELLGRMRNVPTFSHDSVVRSVARLVAVAERN